MSTSSEVSLPLPRTWEEFRLWMERHPEAEHRARLLRLENLEEVLVGALDRDGTLFQERGSPALGLWEEAAREMARTGRAHRGGPLWMAAREALGESGRQGRVSAVATFLLAHPTVRSDDLRHWMKVARDNPTRARLLVHPAATPQFRKEALFKDDGLFNWVSRRPEALGELRAELVPILIGNVAGSGERLLLLTRIALAPLAESHAGFPLYLEAALVMGRTLGAEWTSSFFQFFRSSITPGVAARLLATPDPESRLDAIRALGELGAMYPAMEESGSRPQKKGQKK